MTIVNQIYQMYMFIVSGNKNKITGMCTTRYDSIKVHTEWAKRRDTSVIISLYAMKDCQNSITILISHYY